MPRVLCTLTHASTRINGVAFSAVDGGMLSDDDLPEDVAANFLSIPGYRLIEEAAPPAVEPRRPGRPSNASKAAAKAESSQAPAPASVPVKPAPAPPAPSGGVAPVSKDGVMDHVEPR